MQKPCALARITIPNVYNLKQHHDIDGFFYFVAINLNFIEDENYLNFNQTNVNRSSKRKKYLIKYIA